VRLIAAVIVALGAAAALWPNPRAWQSLGRGVGRVRWVATRTDALTEHPLAPEWIRSLRRTGIPWPTDLPLAPLGPSFGGQGDDAAAWYLVRSARPSLELWNLDKTTAELLSPAGEAEPFRGASGAALVDERRRTQFVCAGVPADRAGRGWRLRCRLVRYEGRAATRQETQVVTLPF